MKYWCLIVGIIAVAGVECFAISQGIDGTVLAGALAVIGAMVGFAFGYFPTKVKK
ncbi:hypothetical protein ES703_13920 [subsurface metagenome]